jgi:cytoskeletal protein CcmA (bactofilin family)
MKADSPPNALPHVDEVTGLLYIEGQLEQADARGVVAHVEQCSVCRRLLDTLKQESLLLRQALMEEDEAVPAALLAPRISEGLSWWWLSMLSLAGLGMYTLWSFYLEPWVENFRQSGFDAQFFFTWLLLNGASWKGWNEMLQWVIVGSLGVLASVVLFLLRRNLRRISSLSIFLAALLLLMLVLPPAAQGAEFVKRSHAGYELPTGQTVRTDLFLFVSGARIAGTVDGDLYCFCSSLTIDGHVTGDVIAFAGEVQVSGKVDGNVRSFNGHLLIQGDVERNVLSFVGNFQTTPHSHIGGSATLYVGSMQLDGPLGRDLTAFLGEGTLNAPIGGDVLLRQSTGASHDRWAPEGRSPVQVTSQADIKGSFRVRGPLRPVVSPDAHLASAPQFEFVEQLPAYRDPMAYWYNAMIWGTAFLVGLVLISLAPGFMYEASRQVSRIGAPLGLGFAAFVLLPVAGALACATVVGLGLGIPAIFLWLFLIFFGQAFAAIWVGETILGEGSGAWALTGRLALGLLLIRLGALIPVLGFWIRFVACLLGTGALTLMVYHRLQPRIAQTPAAPLPATPPAA